MKTDEVAFASAVEGAVEVAIEDERRRVLQLIESHRASLLSGSRAWAAKVLTRLENCIRNGLDLEEEMELPIEERAMFFHWPDAK